MAEVLHDLGGLGLLLVADSEGQTKVLAEQFEISVVEFVEELLLGDSLFDQVELLTTSHHRRVQLVL